MKTIETFEDACKALGYESNNIIPDFSMYPEKDSSALEAHAKLVVITDALNRTENNGQEWNPDWDNSSEYKYYPWFEMSSLGFRFSVCDYWRTGSSVGSRLCFKTSKLAEYAGQQFEDLYKDYFVKMEKVEPSQNLSGKKITVDIDGEKYSATID